MEKLLALCTALLLFLALTPPAAADTLRPIEESCLPGPSFCLTPSSHPTFSTPPNRILIVAVFFPASNSLIGITLPSGLLKSINRILESGGLLYSSRSKKIALFLFYTAGNPSALPSPDTGVSNSSSPPSDLAPAHAPEPATLLLLGTGIGLVAGAVRRKSALARREGTSNAR